MPDQRSVMKEFRSLDKKRAAGPLTPAEEARYEHLRDLVGPETGAGSLRPGFDVDAAAAQLRDSLLPAGLRNRPPPPPAPAQPEPEPEVAEPSAADALASIYAAEPFAPLEAPPQQEGFFEPSSLSPEGAEPPHEAGAAGELQQPWDPNAQYEAAQGYDPNAPGGWDPGAPYDPGAPEAAAQAQEPGAAWDTGAAYDADVPGAAPPTYDPNASPEAGAQAYPLDVEPPGEADLLAEPAFAQEGSPSDAALPPEGWFAETASGAAPEGAEAAPAGDDAGLDSLLPFDPAAAAAITPGEMPEGFGDRRGEYDDTAGFDARRAEATPADLPQEGADFQATQSMAPEATEGWPSEAVLEDGFELASGGSFDAAAEAAAPEWAGGTPAPPWESAPALDDGTATFAAPGAAAVPAEAFDEAAAASAPAPADALPELSALDAGLAEPPAEPALAADDFSVDVEAEPEAPSPGDAPTLDFSQPDFSQGVSDEEAAFVGVPAPAGAAAAEAPFDLTVETLGGASPLDVGAVPGTEGPEPAAAAGEEDIPTIEGEEILEEIPAEEAAVASPAPPAPSPPPAVASALPVITPPPAVAPAPPVIAPPPVAAAAPPRPSPIAPPAPPAAAGPPPPARPSGTVGAGAEPVGRIPGSHRVVVHTLEGQVKRGVLEDVDLDAGALDLVPQPGAAPEVVPSEKVKAIFFMLGPGEKAPAPQGKKVRVTFRDGRQVAGFSPDYRETGTGFFMIPGDTRTNTGRIWVYRSAVRQVSVS